MIPFNKLYMTGSELGYITQAHSNSNLSGDGDFTKKCHRWLENNIGSYKALLTHSALSKSVPVPVAKPLPSMSIVPTGIGPLKSPPLITKR